MGKAWQTQIVLCYEQEPYLAFDATSEMLAEAIVAENPPTDDDAMARNWLVAKLTQLREDVALIRDHSDELMEAGRRDLLMSNAIMMVQFFLTSKGQSMATARAVVFNLLARQSSVEAGSPSFQIAVLANPLTVEEIRAMSTTNYLYIQEGDTFIAKMARSPTQRSKVRSKDRPCISIGAYWHNDRPGGIMLELNINLEQGQSSLESEMNLLDQLVMSLAEQRPSAEHINEYLCHMAQQKAEDYGFQIMAVIAYAEEAGHIPSDEFNGMVYLYGDEDEIFVARKDQPSKPPA